MSSLHDRARLGIGIGNAVPAAETVRLAQLAESLGIGEAWVPEVNHGRSAIAVAAAIAQATEKIGIGIGVVNPYWRHPALLAMEAGTLDDLSGGRLRFGIGPAVWTLRGRGEADDRLNKPLTATVETVKIIKALFRGEPVPSGGLFPIRSDAHLDFTPVRRNLPIYVGAVNAKMLEATGEIADGVQLGGMISPGYVRWARERVNAGLARADRDSSEFDFIGNVLVSVAADRVAARKAARPVLAYYLHRVEAVVTDLAGADPGEVADARRAYPELGPELAAERLAEGLIDVFAAAGTPDDVRDRLNLYVDAGLQAPLAWNVLGPDRFEAIRLLAKEVWA